MSLDVYLFFELEDYNNVTEGIFKDVRLKVCDAILSSNLVIINKFVTSCEIININYREIMFVIFRHEKYVDCI